MGLRTLRTRIEDANIELNLAPMLSLMVSLIPCLLLSAAFVHITMIDTPIPQIVAEKIEQEKTATDRKTNIILYVSNDRGFDIQVDEKGQSRKILIPTLAGKLDFEKLHSELVKLKQVYPELFRFEINPDETVAYRDLVMIMDRSRTTQKGDPTLYLQDDKTGKKVEHNQLFPNVVFANIVGA